MPDRSITRVFVGLAALLVVFLGTNTVVFAQDNDSNLTQDRLTFISQHCSSSQFALQQIEKRDAVSRINRGRDYDQMLRQVSALNSRFAYNKISAPDLIQLTTNIQSAVDSFRSLYDKYDTGVTSALNIDCKNKPTDYYNAIIQARADRNAVGAQVSTVGDLMAQYKTAVLNYRNTAQ